MTVRILLATLVGVASMYQVSSAAIVSAIASDNATVRPAGPRTGTSGKAFFNVEGDTAGGTANNSYGIIDFTGSTFATTGTTGVTGFSLALTESNASFSAPGSVEIYLASDNSANDQPTTSTVPNYTAGATPMGIGSTTAFGTLYDLGTLAYTTTGNVNTGQTDTFTASSLSSAASTLLKARLNDGGVIRLVLTPNTAATAATYAGFSNTTATTPGPKLTLTTTAVPEPASLAAIGLAGVALIGRRRK